MFSSLLKVFLTPPHQHVMTSKTIERRFLDAGCTLNGDRFGGVTLTFQKSAKNIPWDDAFRTILQAWKKEKKYRGVWLELSPKINSLAGIIMQGAINNGFELHTIHGALIVLKQWLPNTESVLPDAPHHQLGVAGMVVNGRGEVLVIQERRGPTARLKNFWKLPGGLVDPKEDITAAVAREVLEETGIHAQFHSIATFRETHNGPFGSTDLYAVCAMTLVDQDAYTTQPSPKPVTPHPDEIKACEWIPMEEFLGSPYYKKGLYGSLLKTAAPAAQAAAAAAQAAAAVGDQTPGLRELRMDGLGGKKESMFYAGKAKL